VNYEGGLFIIGIATLPWLAGWLYGAIRSRRMRRRVELDAQLDRVDLLGFLGRHDEMSASIEMLWRDAEAVRGADGALPRAHGRVLRADLAASQERPSIARAHLESALADLDEVEDASLALELRARVEASLALLATAEDSDETLLEYGDSAMEHADAVSHRDTIVRLAEASHWLGVVHHRRGRWNRSRPFLESSVGIAERLKRPRSLPEDAPSSIEWVYWSRARAAGASAAVELGQILCSLGEHEDGLAWLDRAIALLEGGQTSLARFALAKALLARAGRDTGEPLLRMERRRVLLQRAIEAGLASGWPGGRCAASEAELNLAFQHLSLGAQEEAVRHLRRAHDHVRDLDDPDATPFVQHPMLALGFVLEERGDHAGACEHYRLVVDRGRDDVQPETRRFAALAAYRLHRLLIERDHTREAAEALETLEGLVPACAPEARTLLSGLACRARAVQLVHEKKRDEARGWFERAEELGRQADTAESRDFVREVAADLGRLG
jgi:tetratricopeptide (TPR) repeat protein